MEYKEIIELNIKEAKKKRSDNPEYWDLIIHNLVSDLKDFEGKGRWSREPMDEAWNRLRKVQDPMDAFRKIWKDMTGEDPLF